MVNKADKPDPLIGIKLGDYTIQALIGRGGMARVYEGLDEKLGRRAAVKVMEVQHDQGDELTQRFIREARAAASLEHANIVNVYQFGETNDMYYMAMKLIEGRTLLNLLKQLRKQKKYLEPEIIVSIVEQIGSALDYAHSKGVIHRDIKPSNIMLSDDFRAVLTDFGLTMRVGSETTLGTAFGTPRYIAPEQAIASHKAVPQSDIYALGIVLFEMATNQAPFDSDSPMTLALSHITNKPPMPQSIRPDLPHPVQTVILKALEKRPENRWQTAAELTAALKDAYHGKEPNVVLTQEVLELPGSVAVGDSLPGIPAPAPAAPAPAPTSTDGSVPSAPVPATIAPIVDKNGVPIPQPTGLVITAPKPSRSIPRARLRIFATFLLMLLAAVIGITLANAQINGTGLPLGLVAGTPSPIPPRVRLIYSIDSFVVYNPTQRTLSLENYSFVKGDSSITFDASKFGNVSSRNLGPGQCLRIMLRSADEKNLPYACPLLARQLIYNDNSVVFWAAHDENDSTSTFLVTKFGKTVQTCLMRVNTCEVDITS